MLRTAYRFTVPTLRETVDVLFELMPEPLDPAPLGHMVTKTPGHFDGTLTLNDHEFTQSL